MKYPNRFAILGVPHDFLCKILQVPEGAEIVDLDIPFDQKDMLYVKVQGLGYLTQPGGMVTRVDAKVTDADGKLLIDWQLPDWDTQSDRIRKFAPVLPDTPIWVRRPVFNKFPKDDAEMQWVPRHFAGVNHMGQVSVFPHGLTSHTSGLQDLIIYHEASLEQPA